MNYIVFDLEWNQSSSGEEPETALMPFEIIEIGAVKLNSEMEMEGEFSRLICPQVYHQMHRVPRKLLKLTMSDLEGEEHFPEVTSAFLNWSGENGEPVCFCTWGTTDLTELQRNMRFYHMTPLSDRPLAFLDVQKLFSKSFGKGSGAKSLEYAVEFLEIPKEESFHRAYGDAYYTAVILQVIARMYPDVMQYVSYDLFHAPASREQEIRVQFPTYHKYISREFDSKSEAFADKEVSSTKCYLCHRNLRKKLKWFSTNSKHYYSLAYCEKHGYFKYKVRIKKSDSGKTFVVKTSKQIPEEKAAELKEQSVRARMLKKKANQKQMMKRPQRSRE
ncbi:MAG: exonuclease domain-containing protein [Acetatifactor sp.]